MFQGKPEWPRLAVRLSDFRFGSDFAPRAPLYVQVGDPGGVDRLPWSAPGACVRRGSCAGCLYRTSQSGYTRARPGAPHREYDPAKCRVPIDLLGGPGAAPGGPRPVSELPGPRTGTGLLPPSGRCRTPTGSCWREGKSGQRNKVNPLAGYLQRHYQAYVSPTTILKIFHRHHVGRISLKKYRLGPKPADAPLGVPGRSVQLDVKFVPHVGKARQRFYPFTAIDEATRFRVLRIYDHNDTKTASDFLREVREQLPFAIQKSRQTMTLRSDHNSVGIFPTSAMRTATSLRVVRR